MTVENFPTSLYKYVGGRVRQRDLGNGTLRMTQDYNPAEAAGRVTGTTHEKLSGGVPVVTLEDWDYAWDDSYNKTGRTDVARDTSHGYEYDGLNRMTESQKDEETPVAYPLDPSGNRAATGYDLTGLHAYAATPQGTFTYSVSGRMTGTNTTTKAATPRTPGARRIHLETKEVLQCFLAL